MRSLQQIFPLFVLIGVFATTACGPMRSATSSSSEATPPDNASGATGPVPRPSPTPASPVSPTPSLPGVPTPRPTATPDPSQAGAYKIEAAPLWEPHASSGRSWTSYAFGIVDKFGISLMLGTKDVKEFCPAFFSLSRDEKLNFWVYLISAVVKYESAFDPTSRMKEPGMGTDPVTGQPVYSEGLLQLSYQDSLGYKFCDEFDWRSDSKLAVRDPKKTILDPYKNLACGIRILNQIVARKDLIAFDSGHYWSTLKPSRANSKVPPIKKLTNGIPFCKL